MTFLLDAHNHLQDPWLAPHLQRVLAELPAAGVGACVVNGTSESDWPDVARLCSESRLPRRSNPGAGSEPPTLTPQLILLPSYGLHPWNVGNASPEWREHLRRHLDAHASLQSDSSPSPPPAIGEMGLDRWILDRARPDDSRLAGLRRASLDEQREAFEWQVALAAERNLPLTIHCIDAWGALLDALRRSPRPARGFLLHAYGGSAELACEFAAIGAYFSFNGYFLGERQAARRSVFETLPPDRLLVETDAPAMPLPASCRTHELPGLADGNPINHPANLRAVYAGLAGIREVPFDELATLVAGNFARLFGLVPSVTT